MYKRQPFREFKDARIACRNDLDRRIEEQRQWSVERSDYQRDAIGLAIDLGLSLIHIFHRHLLPDCSDWPADARSRARFPGRVRRLRYQADGLCSERARLPDAVAQPGSRSDWRVALHLLAVRLASSDAEARKRVAFAPRQAAPQAPSAEPAQTRR